MILIALGANLPSRYGAPEDTLKKAITVLEEKGLKVLKHSSIWLTAPVPVSDQPWYRNAVVCVQTDMTPQALLKLLQSVEADFGRVRTVRNAPRLLDLDIIAYDDQVLAYDDFRGPHPRMESRAFVLRPLQEIAPDWKHPVSGLSIGELLSALPDNQEIQKAA